MLLTEKMTIRLTAEEKELFAELSALHGRKPGGYIRALMRKEIKLKTKIKIK